MTSLIKHWSRKKTYFANEQNVLKRTFNTYDLIFLGVGSTLGVGIYILSGKVAKDVTGPAIVISFLLAAIISLFAGLCYAELGAASPTSGSIYSYCYTTLGEFVAFLMGWNLLTEYIIGAASVVKALSVYLDSYSNYTIQNYLRELYEIDVPFLAQYFDAVAFIICVWLAVVLSFGLKESVLANNILTSVNIALVLFFVIAGLTKINFANWDIPASQVPANAGSGGFFPYGFNGVIQGAGMCFYGFLGFDSITTTGAEVKNPEKTLPIAIIASLAIIFFAYFGLSTVLTLLLPYYLQNEIAPLSFAFQFVGYDWAKWIVSIGSIFGLIASSFGAFFPVSRILFAMANDGLIFRSLANINPTYGTPVRGTLVSGVITGLTAALLDVDQLISLNSIGTLLSYSTVALCLIILRYSVHDDEKLLESKPLLHRIEKIHLTETHLRESTLSNTWRANHVVSVCIILFCMLSVLLGLMFNWTLPYQNFLMLSVIFLMSSLVLVINSQVTRNDFIFAPFKMPMVPYLPALSIFLNIYLMLQFNLYTWMRFFFWILVGFIIYFTYGMFRSTERLLSRRNSTA